MLTRTYATAPIIVVGAPHSGTRAVAQILSQLGSDGGRSCQNNPKENLLFVNIHLELVRAVDASRRWERVISDPAVAETYKDDGSLAERIRLMLENRLTKAFPRLDFDQLCIANRHGVPGNNLSDEFPRLDSHPWHWKCPASALFLESWTRVFPQARYVHLQRDPYEVAECFVRRREMVNPLRAIRLVAALNQRVRDAQLPNLITVRYNNLPMEVERLAAFLGLETSEESIRQARQHFVRPERSRWNTKLSMRANVWRKTVSLSINTLRTLRPRLTMQ